MGWGVVGLEAKRKKCTKSAVECMFSFYELSGSNSYGLSQELCTLL